MDMGDFVIVINADKVVLTGNKMTDKYAYQHSQYPGGLTERNYVLLMEKFPTRAVEKAIKGMLPKNSIGKQMASKLKVYAGAEHPHASQAPIPYTFTQIDQTKVGK
jgi:large subunit ribosomal protein L13